MSDPKEPSAASPSSAPASSTSSASSSTPAPAVSSSSSSPASSAPSASSSTAPASSLFGGAFHNPFALSSTASSFSNLGSASLSNPASSSSATGENPEGGSSSTTAASSTTEEFVSGADSTAEYTPLVKLEIIETATGEENEETVYKHRAALYRFALNIDGTAMEWKERGRGDVRLQKNKASGKIRILLRQDKTLKVCLNHPAYPELNLTPNAGSDRSWTWRCTDYSGDGAEDTTFALKFKDSETAAEFKKQFEIAQKTNADIHSKEKTEKK